MRRPAWHVPRSRVLGAARWLSPGGAGGPSVWSGVSTHSKGLIACLSKRQLYRGAGNVLHTSATSAARVSATITTFIVPQENATPVSMPSRRSSPRLPPPSTLDWWVAGAMRVALRPAST